MLAYGVAAGLAVLPEEKPATRATSNPVTPRVTQRPDSSAESPEKTIDAIGPHDCQRRLRKECAMSRQTLLSSIAIAGAIGAVLAIEYRAEAQAAGPTLVDSNLRVTAAASGFIQPTSFAFIGANDVLVLEKAS